MERKNLVNFILILVGFLATFVIGYKVGTMSQWSVSSLTSGERSVLDSNNKDVNFSLFWAVWDKMQEKYVDKNKLTKDVLMYSAIKGVAAAAGDPYTFFLTPKEHKQAKDDMGGRFEGIGAQLGTKNGVTVVIAPMKESPAEKAGVRAGDAILKINGEEVQDKPVTYVVSKIRGPAGTKVSLTLGREDEKIDVEIVRSQIKVDSIETEYKDGIAIVKLNQFGETTLSEWQQAVSEIAPQYASGKIKGMVLDLRNNPGGFLDTAVEIASDFLPMDALVVRQQGNGMDYKYTVRRRGQLLDIPITVIINGGSASASEILSGALRDYGRARLVGEKSFGKGSVQEVIDMAEGAGLHVTVAKWILPKGDWIHGKGIDPEFKVVNDKIDAKNTVDKPEDKQLEKAIELLFNTKAKQ